MICPIWMKYCKQPGPIPNLCSKSPHKAKPCMYCSMNDCSPPTVQQALLISRGRQLFNTSFMLAYLNDACMMMQQLPVIQSMKEVLEGRATGWMGKPGSDFYRLQYMRRYRFSQVKRSSPCECASCKPKE